MVSFRFAPFLRRVRADDPLFDSQPIAGDASFVISSGCRATRQGASLAAHAPIISCYGTLSSSDLVRSTQIYTES